MAGFQYLNFDLLLESEGEGEYQARVVASPLADLPHVRFRLPFDATTLENLLLKLDPGRSGVRGPGLTLHEEAARDFGGPLYESIFTGDLAVAWSRSLDRARAMGADGLRLRLRLDDAPGLVGLPWELLYDAKGRSFLAQSERTPLVRFLDVVDEPRPINVDGPLRVLAIISSPLDVPELDVEREWRRIKGTLAAKVDGGLVVVDRLPEATIAELGEWLLHHETHVIHFVGHGDFDSLSGEGFILMQNERGQSDAVDADVLGPFVQDHDPLRLLLINACRSARVGVADPYGGLAQGLVLRGAMAVIAMQFPISDDAAVKFTGDFYGALAAALPVDRAVGYARKTLHARFRSEWATPVLFMRSPDGNIFEGVHAPAQWPSHVPPMTDSPPEPPVPPNRHDLGPDDRSTGQPDDGAHEGSRRGVIGWMRTHMRTGLAAAAALALAIAGASWWWSTQGTDALDESQLLVAAGESLETMNIHLVDQYGNDKQLTHGDGLSWLPVLSPDRKTMLYIRQHEDTNGEMEDSGELRIARAIDGGDDRPFFDPPPPECSTSSGRPSWIPSGDDDLLVLRCQSGDIVRLVEVKVDGTFVKTLFVCPKMDRGVGCLGDPTVFPNAPASTVVLFYDGAGERNFEPGISAFDMESLSWVNSPLLAGSEYADPVFSHETGRLAWTKGVTTPEVFVSGITEHGFLGFPGEGQPDLTTQVQISPSDVSGILDQDPSFSPDGSQIVYTEAMDGRSELVVSDVDGSNASLVAMNFIVFSTPAWSAR